MRASSELRPASLTPVRPTLKATLASPLDPGSNIAPSPTPSTLRARTRPAASGFVACTFADSKTIVQADSADESARYRRSSRVDPPAIVQRHESIPVALSNPEPFSFRTPVVCRTLAISSMERRAHASGARSTNEHPLRSAAAAHVGRTFIISSTPTKVLAGWLRRIDSERERYLNACADHLTFGVLHLDGRPRVRRSSQRARHAHPADAGVRAAFKALAKPTIVIAKRIPMMTVRTRCSMGP